MLHNMKASDDVVCHANYVIYTARPFRHSTGSARFQCDTKDFEHNLKISPVVFKAISKCPRQLQLDFIYMIPD